MATKPISTTNQSISIIIRVFDDYDIVTWKEKFFPKIRFFLSADNENASKSNYQANINSKKIANETNTGVPGKP